MRVLILNLFKYSDATLRPDRLKNQFIISPCEAFKREVHPLISSIISILIVL
jgi:hypothetical protein